MNPTGDVDLLVASRSALLDALEALRAHRDAVIVIGAQAIYLHTGAAPVGLAEATKDSDLAIDTRVLPDHPLLEQAMTAAGFHRDPNSPQPGSWLTSTGIPVDLMVPESLAGGVGRRGARIPPHSKHAARQAAGWEAALVDHVPIAVHALAPDDRRSYTANVAGPAALLVAKLHKLGERQATPGRLVDKDAHDLFRLMVAIPAPVREVAPVDAHRGQHSGHGGASQDSSAAPPRDSRTSWPVSTSVATDTAASERPRAHRSAGARAGSA